MRWLKWSLLFWLVSLPLFYAFGLPALMGKLSSKAEQQLLVQCQTQLKNENIAYTPLSIVKPEEGDKYCHCVSDGLTLTLADLPSLMQHQQPPRLEKEMATVVEGCNKTLQESMKQPTATPLQPHSTKNADGTETVYFN